jgi:hypothetical protein
MATRCNKTRNLEYHHINRSRGGTTSNGLLLCHDCHVKTGTYGKPGDSPPDFTDEAKKEIRKRAGGRCECRRDSCHG